MTSSTPLPQQDGYHRDIKAVIRPGKNRRILAQARDHTVTMDIYREMGGDDTAPTPGEFLLLSLGGCILNLARMMAEEKGLPIKDLEVNLTGALDLEKAFGRPTQKRAGYSRIDVVVDFDSNTAPSDQDAFLEELIGRCPVCETIMNRVPVHFTRKNA